MSSYLSNTYHSSFNDRDKAKKIAFIETAYNMVQLVFKGARWKLKDDEIRSEFKRKGIGRIAQLNDLLSLHKKIAGMKSKDKSYYSWIVEFNNVRNYANMKGYNAWIDAINSITVSGLDVAKGIQDVNFTKLEVICGKIDMNMHTFWT